MIVRVSSLEAEEDRLQANTARERTQPNLLDRKDKHARRRGERNRIEVDFKSVEL